MPIKNHILAQHRLLYMDHSGVITARDVAENYNRFRTMSDAHRVRFALADLRSIEGLHAYFDGMASVAHMIASDGEDMAEPWEIALLSNATGQYPLLLDYASQVRRYSRLRCEVLPTLEKAMAWLGIPAEAIADIASLNRAEDQSIDGTT